MNAVGVAVASQPLSVMLADALCLEIFESVPSRCIAHAAKDDRTAPLIRSGEVAIVETTHDEMTGWIPNDGGLYLIEYEHASLMEKLPHLSYFPSRARRPRTREIIQVRRHVHEHTGEVTWSTGPYCRPKNVTEANAQAARGFMWLSDGPFESELDIAEKLIGPVVGIYRPGWSDSDG